MGQHVWQAWFLHASFKMNLLEALLPFSLFSDFFLFHLIKIYKLLQKEPITLPALIHYKYNAGSYM